VPRLLPSAQRLLPGHLGGAPSLNVFKTAARGLEAQRLSVAASTENLANAGTTRTEEEGPYQLKRAVHENEGGRFARFLHKHTLPLQGSDPRHRTQPMRLPPGRDLAAGPATEIVEEEALRFEYDPSHPHADENGYVAYPDVNVAEEMARLISAQRVYEANLTTVEAAKEMLKRTLEI